jgi:hypothetical protein
MLKSGTHFEQVPLETVRKIVEDQIRREIANGAGIQKEGSETAFAEAEEASTSKTAMFLMRSDRSN